MSDDWTASLDRWLMRSDLDERPPSPLHAPPTEMPEWFRTYVARCIGHRGWSEQAVDAEALRRWRVRR